MSRLLLYAWLFASLLCLSHVAAVDDTERAALIDIANALVGLPANWNSNPDPCQWVGIACVDSHISVLSWSSMDLSGSLHNSFYNLPHLLILDLSSNRITGTLPDSLGFLRSATSISLGYNQFTGSLASSISYLANISSFHLQHNQLSGSLPTGISNWIKLDTLAMAGNRFSGSLPDIFGSMIALQEVSLGNNSFTGSIPSSLYERSTLKILNLESNQMSGSLTNRVSQWTSLTSLQINNNAFSGTIPSETGSMVKIRDFDLRFNQFTGSIPDVFQSSTHLMYFLVNDNSLEGPIPASLMRPSLTAISLSRTNLRLCNPSVPASTRFTFGSLAYCDVSGMVSCGCSSLWAGCAGAIHCPDSQCYGEKPWPTFYCAENGWRYDTDLVIPSGTNITLVGETHIMGTLSMDKLSTLKFQGLEPTLYLTSCADVVKAEVSISEEDLKKIIASKASVYVDTLMLAPCGVATIFTTSSIAPGCKQARSNVVVDRSPEGIWSIGVEYTGYYSACATWTIPVLGAIHALFVAAGIGYLVITYCRPGSR